MCVKSPPRRRCRYTPVVYYNMCVRVLRVWFASRPAAVVSCVWVIRNYNSNKYANPENSTTGVYIIYIYVMGHKGDVSRTSDTICRSAGSTSDSRGGGGYFVSSKI
uniref:Uncharacterized protein n=1 Tax=Schizaphis graminum TaxID=13262 RepID=A0A2S2P6R6_SCHGA